MENEPERFTEYCHEDQLFGKLVDLQSSAPSEALISQDCREMEDDIQRHVQEAVKHLSRASELRRLELAAQFIEDSSNAGGSSE